MQTKEIIINKELALKVKETVSHGLCKGKFSIHKS